MKDNPFVVSSHEVAKDSEYRKWLFEVKNRYKKRSDKIISQNQFGTAFVQLAAWA